MQSSYKYNKKNKQDEICQQSNINPIDLTFANQKASNS